ncbi:hypothetical protein FIE12Z_1698 [Fusarium flagelliforme]|uniref:Uncharacterized protein n=1 Tax=Fusarium flagelliforme TaxID=2675880 RepID=A0A395N1F0_9HYPO|nr:hypothetical protein FIE12Z_1698 [Fusarium flagelliforme]
MEARDLHQDLTMLLSQHFQIVTSNSQRQDQWYKRSLQSFTFHHGDKRPLILVPRESREEWAPHLRRFASSLASMIGATDGKAIEHTISGSKLFSDDVLDEAHSRPLCLAVTDSKPLSPDMMQMSWWTTKTQHPDDKARRLKGIKALIACGQTESLLRLASWPETHPDRVTHLQNYQWKSLNNGWQTAVDKIIVIILFLGATGAFHEELLEKDGYKYWLPVAFLSYKSPFTSYIEAFGGRIPATDDGRQRELGRCVEGLRTAQAWSLSTETPINWEERIMDKFLYILGFEAWNRSRQGEGYLGCDLNKPKDAKSLQGVGLDDYGDEELPVREAAKKRIDPLKLREPKKDVEVEPTEEERTEMNKLAALEDSEVDYGRKRSTKYFTKNK